MNRWYKKTVTKAVLLVLAVLSGAVFVTNLFGALTIAGTANPAELWGMTDQSFEDSEDFNMQVENVMMDIMFDIPSRDDIARVRITRDAILGAGAPLLEYKE